MPTTQDAGTMVTISSVTVSEPTWVVLYDNVSGKPGKALGAHLQLPAQNSKASYIKLMRATVAGMSYLVGERIDNGDSEYATATDKEVVGSDGKSAYMTISVQAAKD
jgi:hypothetical protein